MYSKEDRERILADFRASGMTRKGFCDLPGRPSREALREWELQAEAGGLDVPRREVRGRCEHLKHSRYPEATRREALSLVRKGMRPCDVARRLGVSSGTVVSSWARADGRARMSPEAVGMDDTGGRHGTRRETRAELQARLDEAVMENRVLRELMRDPKAGDPESLSNRRRTELGERLRRDYGYSLRSVTAFLRVPRSTYEYDRRANERAAARAEAVSARVREAFEASGRTYGYRRVRAAVLAGADGGEPMSVSEREVRRAMRSGHMVARRTHGRLRYSSYAGEPDERPANLPLGAGGAHDFSAPRPDMLVVTDVTEFGVGGAKVYLSPVVDCFDGMPVGWSISRHPDSGLCDSSLASYLASLPEGHAPVVEHSDGGSPYRAGSWKRLCAGNGVVRSMSRKGHCPDNARAEGFFGTLKEEFYNGRDWSREPPDRFAEEFDAYVRWYRDGRLKAFSEGGRTVYDTIAGRRRRLGYVV